MVEPSERASDADVLTVLLRGRGATAVAQAGPRGEHSSPSSTAGPPPLRDRQVSATSRVPAAMTQGVGRRLDFRRAACSGEKRWAAKCIPAKAPGPLESVGGPRAARASALPPAHGGGAASSNTDGKALARRSISMSAQFVAGRLKAEAAQPRRKVRALVRAMPRGGPHPVRAQDQRGARRVVLIKGRARHLRAPGPLRLDRLPISPPFHAVMFFSHVSTGRSRSAR